jgi:hypothetical protein
MIISAEAILTQGYELLLNVLQICVSIDVTELRTVEAYPIYVLTKF